MEEKFLKGYLHKLQRFRGLLITGDLRGWVYSQGQCHCMHRKPTFSLWDWGFCHVQVVLRLFAHNNFKDSVIVSKLETTSVSICALIPLLPFLAVLETGAAGAHQWREPFSSSYWCHIAGEVEYPACGMWCFARAFCTNYGRSLCFCRNSWFKYTDA